MAAVKVANGAKLTVDGKLTSVGDVTAQSGGTITGGGTIVAPTVIDGTIAPAGTTNTIKTNNFTANSGGNVEMDVDSVAGHDQIDVTGSVSLNNANLVLSGLGAPPGAGQEIVLIKNDGADAVMGRFNGLPQGATVTLPTSGAEALISYAGGTDNNDVVLMPLTAYQTWALAQGLAQGVNDSFTDDPDGDGWTNIMEFGFDGNPLSGLDSGKVVTALSPLLNNEYLTLTLPVRTGAVFAGSPGLRADHDGVSYRIEGSSTLQAYDAVISEVAPALSSGLPAPSVGWDYHTFRFPDPTLTTVKAFLRAGVAPASP